LIEWVFVIALFEADECTPPAIIVLEFEPTDECGNVMRSLTVPPPPPLLKNDVEAVVDDWSRPGVVEIVCPLWVLCNRF
jgi:hypothetical protein